MKKIILLVLIFFSIVGSNVFAATTTYRPTREFYINDFADIITSNVEKLIYTRASAIASEVPIEKLKEKFFSSSHNEEALNKLQLEVMQERDALAKKDLFYYGCGYTPICHMQEQLNDLQNDIFRAKETCRILKQKTLTTSNPVTPQKKSFLSKLFKRI